MSRQNLLEMMQTMRSLVEPEGPVPNADQIDWLVPHRLCGESVDLLMLLAGKLAGHFEKCLDILAGQSFEVTAERLSERYAEQLFTHVIQNQPKIYYLPLMQTGKGHIGFISLPFETAAQLVGCMLRDPEAEIGRDGQMSSLAESILLDAAMTLADVIAKGFSEFGQMTIEKADQLVDTDWPVRFHNLEDLCQFSFKAVCDRTSLNITLTVLDEIIADIAEIEGPFGRTEDKKENPDRIVKRMHEAPIDVTVLLSSTLMTLNDILMLERGDVVILERKTSEPIDVLVNGQTCFCGWPAMHAERRALLITDEKSRLLL